MACLVWRFHSSFDGVHSNSCLMAGRLYRFSVSETLLKKPTFDISCRSIVLCTKWCMVSLVDASIEHKRLNCLLCRIIFKVSKENGPLLAHQLNAI